MTSSCYVLHVDIEIQLLSVDHSMDHGPQVVQQVRQVHGLFIQLHAAASNAAHVQNVVDEAEQMGAGGADLREIILHLLGAVHMGLGKGGEADDGVHGGADVVGHAVEEHGLCLVRLLRGREGKGKLLLLLAQLFVLFHFRRQRGDGGDMRQAIIVPSAVSVAAVKGIEPSSAGSASAR